MMHTHEELYKINGQKFYTKDYIEAHGIPEAKRYGDEGWCKCYGLGPDKGTKNIYTAQGKRVVYTYGEKTWFDTEEERDAYRVQRNIERAEQAERSAMIKTIMAHYENMSMIELKNVLATL